ncbi:hypothetical protein HBI56_170450 [Parastagonospora nodorum]|uniref:Uncharacterized protein n=1 Tax=Phaeosphaeria nodorum (strain SN15 / ATCC MYA-4574 / FGSC 10173) TaxID=321614 RepID=A0A7U2FBA6_PHANO|nr:hypothetical protein HBH54_034080 [Parastagonospora nodorum]QRD01903.1 hypothetical protein JI435_439860 [Parastagonospora nodorum SN15]KAH3938681.1 hypothetical protein HBH53_247390 [Parastagonospora nodorum]KAH3989072.1 hypothetical protein HBH52_023270 [Parastagonospora nodorum]KAH4053265.1 hypothetical protein HBH49_081310 [Parastagonospora nodorum]
MFESGDCVARPRMASLCVHLSLKIPRIRCTRPLRRQDEVSALTTDQEHRALRFRIRISASTKNPSYTLSNAADFLSALCVRICHNFFVGNDELTIFVLRAARPSHPISSILLHL